MCPVSAGAEFVIFHMSVTQGRRAATEGRTQGISKLHVALSKAAPSSSTSCRRSACSTSCTETAPVVNELDAEGIKNLRQLLGWVEVGAKRKTPGGKSAS